ncbi:hypothetical protein LCGC14_1030390 [marine sediment metagenome]|uniref:Uncharacterized protein n=1 Tax=marine sediment metagenome TaxID=412755 RepID=A0A0F9MUS7_9ZZZZ
MNAKAKTPKKSQNNRAPKTEEQKDKDFQEAFEKLCEKHGRGITAIPSLRFSQERNEFGIVVNMSIHRLPPPE